MKHHTLASTLLVLLLILAAVPALAATPAQYNWALRTGYIGNAVGQVQERVVTAKEYVRNATDGATKVVGDARAKYERAITYGAPAVQQEVQGVIESGKKEIPQTIAEVKSEINGSLPYYKEQAKEMVKTEIAQIKTAAGIHTAGIKQVVGEIENKILGILQRNGFGMRSSGGVIPKY